ncbi:MAG TPA: hypothetical protein VLU25_21600 [Acidobacteriota bacterium]|nr:hypothetical protein [Acidobacteriota bacterium]
MKNSIRLLIVGALALLMLVGMGVALGPGTAQACCLDECVTAFDCIPKCGLNGQPACVMNNPCCTECVCLAES